MCEKNKAKSLFHLKILHFHNHEMINSTNVNCNIVYYHALYLLALDNYCDSNPCMNNATCYNRETTFECICNGTFYGMDCAHRMCDI